MSDHPADPPVRDAATVILIDRSAPVPSVLMGMRGAKAAFMPSKYVFPGGAVDVGEAPAPAGALGPDCRRRLTLEPRKGAACSPEELAGAAMRELAEETGLRLSMGQSGALSFIFRAITPPGRTRRFDARFFLIDAQYIAGDPHDFSAACDELSHLHWVPLTQARALDLPFITEVVLSEVTALLDRAGAGAIPVPATVPFFDNRAADPRFVQLS